MTENALTSTTNMLLFFAAIKTAMTGIDHQYFGRLLLEQNGILYRAVFIDFYYRSNQQKKQGDDHQPPYFFPPDHAKHRVSLLLMAIFCCVP